MTQQKSTFFLPYCNNGALSVHAQGILWFISAGLLSTLINTLMRVLTSDFDYHPLQLVFFYSVMGAMTYLPSVLKHRTHYLPHNSRLYLLRAFLEVGGFTLSFYALTLLPFATFTTLMFTVPIIGAVAAVWFLEEEMNRNKWLGLILGFIGIVIVSKPDMEMIHWAIALPLIASLCFAFCGVCIRKMALTDPPVRIAFVTLCLMSCITLPLAITHWQTPTMKHLPYLALLAIMAGSVQFSVGQALAKIKLTTAQPFMFLNLLWSSLLGWMVFDESVALATIIGGGVIIAGIIVSVRKSHAATAKMDVPDSL
jgi:drug/metabolite transporter (DMT)-like permease